MRKILAASFIVALFSYSCITKVEKKIPVAADTAEPGDVKSDDTPEDVADVEDQTAQEVDGTAEDTPQGDAQESALVGPEGGVFLLEGGVELKVPAGAVAGEAITVEALAFPSATVPDGVVALTGAWVLEPEGTVFSKPVTLGFPRNSAQFDIEDWTLLKGFVGEGQAFDSVEVVPAWGSPDGDVVYVQTLHFSLFMAGLSENVANPVCAELEICNGADDDCDGTKDEAPYNQGLAPCVTSGICEGLVEIGCDENGWLCNYDNVEGYEDGDEVTCDGEDNDCDGFVDEGIFGEAISVDGHDCLVEGVCALVSPFVVCAMGQWFCDYSTVPFFEGAAEISCDGKDNDCDGEIDEGACPALSDCTDDASCASGNCTAPLGETGKLCAAHASSCLARREGELVEVGDSGTQCSGAASVVVCDEGAWLSPAACNIAFPGTSSCDEDTGACTAGCTLDTDCLDDGDKCNGTPVCDNGQCETDPGTVVTDCKSDTCADRACNPATGECEVTSMHNSVSCTNDGLCFTLGTCNNGLCVGSMPKDCDDNNICTSDSCNSANGDCINDPLPNIGDSCDDSDPCTLTDLCSTDGDCVGSPMDCNDSIECTFDSCENGVCEHDELILNNTNCNDNSLCTSNDKCQAGVCVGTEKDCNDGKECTVDSCTPGTGVCSNPAAAPATTCTYPTPGTPDPCTPNGTCAGQTTCQPGPNLCGCNTNEDCLSFDNGDLCDGRWICDKSSPPYQCIFDANTIVTCSTTGDSDCRKNRCAPLTGVCTMTDEPNDTPCSDNNNCTLTDRCFDGECALNTPKDCNDNDPCTTDTCTSADGCGHGAAPSTTPCSDGDPCTIGDHCDGNKACLPGAPRTPSCDDSNVCTSDTCSPDGLNCINTSIPGCCLDNTGCVSPDVCFDNACCTPQCSGKECGDDACGGFCGLCGEGEGCVDGQCVCTACCTSDSSCAYNQLCPDGVAQPVCAPYPRIYYRGFEGEGNNTVPSGMTVSWSTSSSTPWKVKYFADGSNCNTGNFALNYNKVGAPGSGNMWFYVNLPDQVQSSVSVLSFYMKCTTTAGFSLKISANDTVLTTLDQSNACDSTYKRFSFDLGAIASGRTKINFEMTKTLSPTVTFYIDDLAVFANSCPTWESCLSFTEVDGLCSPASINSGWCYIEGDCVATDTTHPELLCGVCKPSTGSTAWTPDSTKCTSGYYCDLLLNNGGCRL